MVVAAAAVSPASSSSSGPHGAFSGALPRRRPMPLLPRPTLLHGPQQGSGGSGGALHAAQQDEGTSECVPSSAAALEEMQAPPTLLGSWQLLLRVLHAQGHFSAESGASR